MHRIGGVARAVILALLALGLLAPVISAQIPGNPLNDLFTLGQGTGQTPASVPVQQPPAPKVEAVPRAKCEAGSKPEPGIQGRVPAGSATNGLWCNVSLLSHQGTSGGFKVLRYVDPAGHECAYYDTALLFPLNAFNLNSKGLGVVVLDMSDPAHPKQTELLTDFPMLSPHESLNLNTARGLLAAVSGNPSTYPGVVSLYDAHADCRHPQLQFTKPLARFGHESGFSTDGRTFYATGTATQSITAIDVSDTKNPNVLWQGNVLSHGMSLSNDGNRAYVADPSGRNMLIMDTSQIQARKPNPQVKEISRITWAPASIPQNAIPFSEGGHPYVLEFDEYNASTLGSGSADDVGAGRIIDIADELHPKVIANLRLQVNQPADHHAASGDPGAINAAQGYAAHYCNIPTRVDPKIVACSFIASGLRLFDISDLVHPKEIGYYVAPTQAKAENGAQSSDFAMSQPAFVPERREVWFTDGTSGFYALRVAKDVWPGASGGTGAKGAHSCSGRRKFTVHVKLPRGAHVRSMQATLNGKRVKKVRRAGHTVRVPVDLRKLTKSVATVKVKVRLKSGRTVSTKRVYHPCTRHV
jgi:hypothetical protein